MKAVCAHTCAWAGKRCIKLSHLQCRYISSSLLPRERRARKMDEVCVFSGYLTVSWAGWGDVTRTHSIQLTIIFFPSSDKFEQFHSCHIQALPLIYTEFQAFKFITEQWYGTLSAFQFVLMVFDTVEFRALCRSFIFLHTKTWLSCWGKKGLSC